MNEITDDQINELVAASAGSLSKEKARELLEWRRDNAAAEAAAADSSKKSKK